MIYLCIHPPLKCNFLMEENIFFSIFVPLESDLMFDMSHVLSTFVLK